MNGKLLVFGMLLAAGLAGFCISQAHVNITRPEPVERGDRELAECRKQARGLKQTLAKSVDVIGGLVGAVELPTDESLLYCCDWAPGSGQEDCRAVRDMGSAFCGAIRVEP
jgi:hypothetical protein